jgi:hypothetical protein
LDDHIKGKEMGGACGMYGEEEKCIVLVGKHEGQKTLGRHGHRWKHNIKMNLHRVHIGFIRLSIGTMNIQYP